MKLIKQQIILFWILYFTIIVLSNISNFLIELEILSKTWSFNSNNFQILEAMTKIYYFPKTINLTIFAIIILLQGTTLFSFAFGLISKNTRIIYTGFIIAISIFSIFILGAEIFIYYSMITKHFIILASLIVSLMCFNQEEKT